MGARIAAVAAVVVFAATPAAASTGSLDRSLASAIEVSGVVASNSTAMVVDLPGGQVVYARNPSVPLEPASNEKLGLTYTALVDLGPNYRYPTEVLADGRREGDTLYGDIVLKGFGDPTLSSGDLARLAAILQREGLTRVSGEVIGDASYFDDRYTVAGWLPSFAGLESPPLTALDVDRASKNGMLDSDPPLTAAQEFAAALHTHHIRTGPARVGVDPSEGGVMATIYSLPLSQIIEYMDTISDNFTAEMILKTLGARELGRGTSAAGAEAIREALQAAKVPLQGVRIVDGSGLSRWDRVTGAELSALLVAIWNNPSVRSVVMSGLPVAGETGTLEYRMTDSPARGIVHAKTGTTDIASALSGYVGRRYAFVAIENGEPVNWEAAHTAQDQLAGTLASHLQAAG